MMIQVRTSVAMLILFGVANPVAASPSVSKAEKVIAASKRAKGGTRWDMVQGCVEEGTRADGAIAYTTRFSLETYGLRIDSKRGDSARSMGFNGKVRWQSMGDKVDVRADPDTLREAVLTTYLSINGFFFPDRFPATFTYVREAREAGRTFDVLDITPTGGRGMEVWFDRGAHRIRRVVDRGGSPPVSVEASDYRTVDGLTIAYTLTVSGLDGKVVDTGAVTSFRCGSIDRTIFDPPTR